MAPSMLSLFLHDLLTYAPKTVLPAVRVLHRDTTVAWDWDRSRVRLQVALPNAGSAI